MSPKTRAYETDHALMMSCMMYGYIPTEFFRDTAPDDSEAEASLPSVNPASADAPCQRQSFNIAWLPMIFALVVGVIGIASAVTNPPMADAVSQEFKLRI
jgi:hypothetical protein